MRTITIIVSLVLAGASLPVFADSADDELQNKVKAAFLFNFAKFVTWPPAVFTSDEQPIVFCVENNDPLLPQLEKTIAGKLIGKRPISILSFSAGNAEWGQCNIVHVADGSPIKPVLSRDTRGHSLLIVHNEDSPTPNGAIRFFLKDRKIRFEANLLAAERNKVTISSKLLGIASVVSL